MSSVLTLFLTFYTHTSALIIKISYFFLFPNPHPRLTIQSVGENVRSQDTIPHSWQDRLRYNPVESKLATFGQAEGKPCTSADTPLLGWILWAVLLRARSTEWRQALSLFSTGPPHDRHRNGEQVFQEFYGNLTEKFLFKKSELIQ